MKAVFLMFGVMFGLMLALFAWFLLQVHAMNYPSEVETTEVPHAVVGTAVPLQPASSMPSVWNDSNLPRTYASEPVTVDIKGPRDAVCGDLVHLQAVTTGDARSFKWELIPDVGELLVLDGGRRAAFTNRNPGFYRIAVAVAGGGDMVDFCEHEVELIPSEPEEIQQPQTFIPQPQPVPQQMIPQQVVPQPQVVPQNLETTPSPQFQQTITFKDAVLRSLNLIQRNSRAAEARVLGGCVRSTSNRISTTSSVSDPFMDIRRQALLDLGNAYPAWGSFLSYVETLFNQYRSQGIVNSRETVVAFLDELYQILATVG